MYDYDPATATQMMTDPTWTRAIFVRDPKVRFLSAYLDKAVTHHSYIDKKCCPTTMTCQDPTRTSARAFLDLARICHDAHWDPQHVRMEDKYWRTINFVGHMENVAADAERLLRRVGAWERYGASGWGANSTEFVFEASAGGVGRQHATRAQDKLKKYLQPADEVILDQWYGPDYAHPVMQIDPMQIYSPAERAAAGVAQK